MKIREDRNEYDGSDRPPHERRDCTVIALAHAFNLGYAKAHFLCKQAGRVDGKGFNLHKLLTEDYFFSGRVTYLGRPKMTVGRAAREFSKGRFIVRVSGHCFAMIDGAVLNNRNSRRIIKHLYKIQESL